MYESNDYLVREVADMYLPEKVRNIGLFCLASTIVSVGCAIFLSQLWYFFALCALFFLITGVCALLCYRNQMILICAEDEICYRTFLGNIYYLQRSEFQTVKKNMDSITLVFSSKKVHIEQIAILSPNLEKLIKEWKR